MSQCFVYALVDPRDGSRFYIGQSAIGMERPQQHMRPSAGLKEMTPKAKRVRKLLELGVTPTIEVLQYIADPDEAVPPLLAHYDADTDWGALDMAEMRWIAHGRAVGWPLTNVLDGGDGLRGLVRTPEHCAKISASRVGNQWGKGYVPTPEHRAKISAALTGRVRSPEHAAKISASNKGKHQHSEEHIQKMRIRMSGANNHNFGKKASLEQRAKLSAAHVGVQAGEKNPNYGKKMSEEQKAKISATKRARAMGPFAVEMRRRREGDSKTANPVLRKIHLETGARFALLLAGLATVR